MQDAPYDEAEEVTEEFEVEEIVDSWRFEGTVLYMVKWKDYPDMKDWTEEPIEHLLDAKEALWEYHGRFPKKPRDNKVPKN